MMLYKRNSYWDEQLQEIAQTVLLLHVDINSRLAFFKTDLFPPLNEFSHICIPGQGSWDGWRLRAEG